jgi:hypothetical protein
MIAMMMFFVFIGLVCFIGSRLVQGVFGFAAVLSFFYDASTMSASAIIIIDENTNATASTNTNPMLNAFLLSSDLSILIFIVFGF